MEKTQGGEGMKTGLVSVSFRNLTADAIIDLAAGCGLQCIEWGGDVHVPPGNISLAQAVGDATRAKGLEVACGGGTKLHVTAVLPEGKGRMKAEDFVHCRRIALGDMLKWEM